MFKSPPPPPLPPPQPTMAWGPLKKILPEGSTPQNLGKTMRPILLLCKLFGQVPIDLASMTPSVVGSIYTLVLLSLYLAMAAFITYKRLSNGEQGISLVMELIQTATDAMQNFVSWMCCLYFQQVYIKCLRKLGHVDGLFRKCEVWFSCSKLIKEAIGHVSVRFIVIAASIGAHIYALNVQNKSDIYTPIVMYYTPIMINSVLCFHIVMFVNFIKDMLETLNDNLRALETSAHRPDTEIWKIKVATIQGPKLVELKALRQIHHELIDLVYYINDIFGIQLLFIMGNSFITLISNVHYAFKLIQTTKGDIIPVFGTLSTVVPYVIEISIICYICYTTVQEASLTGTLLHKIRNKDEKSKNEVEMFSLQLVQNPLEFSAAGFFPVDFTLLFSIIGGTSTYLIILLQFSE